MVAGVQVASSVCALGLFCPKRTIIEHDGHLGLLCEGKLMCFKGGAPQLCALGSAAKAATSAAQAACALVPAKHVHGPDCGHESVQHDGHVDYLVDGRLEHVVHDEEGGRCCARGCLEVAPQQVVDHGAVTIIRQGTPGPCKACDAGPALPPALPLRTLWGTHPLLPGTKQPCCGNISEVKEPHTACHHQHHCHDAYHHEHHDGHGTAGPAQPPCHAGADAATAYGKGCGSDSGAASGGARDAPAWATSCGHSSDCHGPHDGVTPSPPAPDTACPPATHGTGGGGAQCCHSGRCYAQAAAQGADPAAAAQDEPPRTAAAASSAPGGAHLTVATKFVAHGICCPVETNLIRNILMPLAGVEEVQVQVVAKTVMVRHDPARTPPGVLLAALNAADMQAALANVPRAPATDAATTSGPGVGAAGWHVQLQCAWQAARGWNALHRWPPLTVLLCGLLLAVSLVSYAPSLPSGGVAPRSFAWAAVAAAAVGGWPILLKAKVAVMNRMLEINALMLLAVAGAIALGDYVEAASIVFLFGLAEWLEARCVQRARNAMGQVLNLQPPTALLLPLAAAAKDEHGSGGGGGGAPARPAALVQAHAVPVEEVPVGSLVLVRPGDRVPLDGTVVQGNSAFDEAMLTGEARFITKQEGSQVFGGTVNVGGGTLVVCTTAAAADSTVARLTALMETAASQRSAREKAVETFAKWYTPCVVLVASMVALVPSLVHMDQVQQWVYLALVVLVTACPCALVIATPVAAVCALTRAAQQGVLFKGSLHLETLGGVRVITFDKSGTLTMGHAQVVHASPAPTALANPTMLPPHGAGGDGGASQAPVAGAAVDAEPEAAGQATLARALRMAAAVESLSSHPLAPAIVGYAAASGALAGSAAGGEGVARSRAEAELVMSVPGLGMLGLVNGHQVVVGSQRLALNMLDPSPHRNSSEPFGASSCALTSLSYASIASTSCADVCCGKHAHARATCCTGPSQTLRQALSMQGVAAVLGGGAFAVHMRGAAARVRQARAGPAALLDEPLPFATTTTGAVLNPNTMPSAAAADATPTPGRLAAGAASHGPWDQRDGAHAHSYELPTGPPLPLLPLDSLPAPHTPAHESPVCLDLPPAAADPCPHPHPNPVSVDPRDGGAATKQLPQQRAAVAWVHAEADLWASRGASVCFVLVDGRPAAVLAVRDTLREHAAEAMRMLEARGVTCAMLTGDQRRTAQSVAQTLGLNPSHVHAELLPADKLRLVAGYRQCCQPHLASPADPGSAADADPAADASLTMAPLTQAEADTADDDLELPTSSLTRTSALQGGATAVGARGGWVGWLCGCGWHLPGLRCRCRHSAAAAAAKHRQAGPGQDGGAGVEAGAAGCLGWRRMRPNILAHIGDGINDAPALASADVGVAMATASSSSSCPGAGNVALSPATAMAMEAGHVLLLTSDLRVLPRMRDLGRRVRNVTLANIGFALAAKVAVLALAFSGVLVSLWVSVLVDVGSALVVVLHALTLLGFQHAHPLADTGQHGGQPKGKASAPCPSARHLHCHGGGGACCGETHAAPPGQLQQGETHNGGSAEGGAAVVHGEGWGEGLQAEATASALRGRCQAPCCARPGAPPRAAAAPSSSCSTGCCSHKAA